MLADEQFHAAGGVVYVPDGDGDVPMVATPADFHGTPWAPRSPAPSLGQHTDEVLAELSEAAARLRQWLEACRVAQLGEEVVGVVAAHQVVRHRDPHDGGCRRRRRGRGSRLQALPHQRKDLCHPPDDVLGFDVDHPQAGIGLLVLDDDPQRRLEPIGGGPGRADASATARS